MSSNSRPGLLSVKGAKYNRRNGDETKDKTLDRIQQIPKGADYTPNYSTQNQTQSNTQVNASKTSHSGGNSGASISKSNSLSALIKNDSSTKLENEKYWKLPAGGGTEDLVIIHVCDENQQISKDFCCKRDILVHHMKYFEKFLAENENGYDDIDISVHCDVEIFEWLMSYIHEPDTPPQIDKSIIVSILISSEFLQMETLVEICIQHVSASLNEIIRLPIDLSCISEKLVNRVAYITPPKTLSETRDKKDKILTKLYKRRVELDFSRKGSSSSTANKNGGSTASVRTIASCLTCCRHCGSVYLDNYVGYLNCRSSPPTINFRGQLASRHSAIAGWSLTSYLKTLHSGGMGWDAIYWHVWAACVVFRVENVMVSALEVDRYTVEADGLLIRASVLKDPDGFGDEDSGLDVAPPVSSSSGRPPLTPKAPLLFSLSVEDDCRVGGGPLDMFSYKLAISKFDDGGPSQPVSMSSNSPAITTSLNPLRPPEVLTAEIFALICSQMKYIVSLVHRQLIQTTMKNIVDAARCPDISQLPFDFSELLWGPTDGSAEAEELAERRRGRSPNSRVRATSMEPRKQLAGKGKAPVASQVPDGGSDSSDTDTANKNERLRSRSSSMGNRTGAQHASTGKLITKVLKKEARPTTTDEDDQKRDPLVNKQISILLSLPPDVRQRVLHTRGPVFGVWNTAHPLQIQSPAHEDMLQTISDTPLLSDSKRLEWELDVMREYDEKRMDRYERLLVSKRNPAVDNYFQFQKARAATTSNNIPSTKQQNKSNTTSSDAKGGAGAALSGKAGISSSDYYKDRGRQTYR